MRTQRHWRANVEMEPPRPLMSRLHNPLPPMQKLIRTDSQVCGESASQSPAVAEITRNRHQPPARVPPPTGPIIVNFAVKCPFVRQHETVFLVGSNPRLGSWLPDGAVELIRDDESSQIWRTKLELNDEETRELLSFRYFIGYYLQPNADPPDKVRIVGRWEAQRVGRTVLPSVEATNGVCRANHVDEFGIFGGQEKVTDGWMSCSLQNELQLRLHSEALQFVKPRHGQRDYYVRAVSFDVRHKEEYAPYINRPSRKNLWRMSSVFVSSKGSVDDEFDDEPPLPALPSFSHTELAVLSQDDPEYRDQRPYGELFRNNVDYFIFRTQSVAFEHLAVRFEFFVEKPSTNSAEAETPQRPTIVTFGDLPVPEKPEVPPNRLERVATAFFMTNHIQKPRDRLPIPILTKSQMPIGTLWIDYLVIKSLSVPLERPLTMEYCYSRYWKKRKTVEVGHRGFGTSYTKQSNVRENTLHSLSHAATRGADYVEFDVQLTKDKAVVVFHDFHVLISVAKRQTTTPPSLTPNSISSGSKVQLNSDRHLMDHYHATDSQDGLGLTGSADESVEHRPFPTLVDVLQHVDVDTGFNIEVKFPMQIVDGEHECPNYFDCNEYIDLILRDVLDYAGHRRIVFSCFDPDICALIARKQSHFPVLFLVIGATERYPSYDDLRSSVSITAVNFAVSSCLLGVNLHSEELLRDRVPVQRAKKFGLVSFVWGDDLNIPANIDYFRKTLNVDGIIYDKIGENEPRQNCFVVERTEREKLFSSQNGLNVASLANGTSPSPSRTSSLDDSQFNNSPTQALALAVPFISNGNAEMLVDRVTDALLLANERPRSPAAPLQSSRRHSSSDSSLS